MKLYWARFSPFARKVMIVAHETGIADRIELIDIAVSMAQANPDILPANPLGKIPTLLLDDGQSLFDSRVICEYLDALGGGSLFPAAPARWDALRRQALADGLMDTLVLWRQERLKPEPRQTPEWLETNALKVATTLAQLDAAADAFAALPFDIGHLAIGCALSYLDIRFADLEWRRESPRLAGWHAAFAARDSAIATDPL